MISDFRVMGDQRKLFGPVASVPTAWRALKEAAAGGDPDPAEGEGGSEPGAAARVGAGRGLPPVRIADRVLEGVACIRLDATVVPAQATRNWRRSRGQGSSLPPCRTPTPRRDPSPRSPVRI